MPQLAIAPTSSTLREDRLAFFSWMTVSVSAVAVFFSNFRFGDKVLAVGYQDDFFYYAQIARNLAMHGVSSFDGIHATNGYHPLWLLLVTVVTRIFDVGGLLGVSTIYPFWIALSVVQTILVLTIAFFTLRLCRYYFSNEVLCCCVQLLCASFSLFLVRTGMEVGLTVLLALAMLCFRLRPEFRWSARDCIGYGLLASLMVLSRLDSVLLVGLLLLLDFRLFDLGLINSGLINSGLINSGLHDSAVTARAGREAVTVPLRARAAHALFFLAGMWPLALYLISNLIWFHTLTPVSGAAKQLRFHHFPAAVVFESIFLFCFQRNTLLLLPLMIATLLAIGAVAGLGPGSIPQGALPAGHRAVLAAILLFPLVQVMAISVLSDWQLWPWYVYPWLVSAVVSAVVFRQQLEGTLGRFGTRLQLSLFTFTASALLIYSALICLVSSPLNSFSVYPAAIDLRNFARQHPGIYAMGDRAGLPGYLLNQPLVQLEGLVMDRDFLNNIKSQRNLVDVLRQYHVRYYISTRAYTDRDGCYLVKEPWQAGSDSPAMHGRICKTPVAIFQHGEFTNHLFEMQSNPPPVPAPDQIVRSE